MRKQLYLDLTTRLLSLLDGEGQPAIKHIDLWNRQVDFLQEEQPFECPAVFIELGEMNWITLGQHRQEAQLTIALHLLTKAEAQTHHGALMQADGLAYLDLIEDINRVLTGFKGDCFGSFSRKKSIPNHDHGEIIESVEHFACRVVDDSATKTLNSTTASPVIDAQYV